MLPSLQYPETKVIGKSDAHKRLRNVCAKPLPAGSFLWRMFKPGIEETWSDAVEESEKRDWLVCKWFDLLFVCGLAPWLMGFFAYCIVPDLLGGSLFDGSIMHAVGPDAFDTLATNPLPKPAGSDREHALTLFLVTVSFLIGESHQFTSILRYYGHRFRKRAKPYFWRRVPLWCMYFVVGIALASLITLLLPFEVRQQIFGAASLPLSLVRFVLSFFVTVFPVILMQHFAAQARAIGITYCRNRGFRLTRFESFALSVVTWLLVIAGGLSIATPFSIPVPADWGDKAVWLAGGACLAFAAHLVLRGLRANEWLPAGAALTWANMALFALLPFSSMLYVWLFVPVFFHATQHWSIAWFTQSREDKRWLKSRSSPSAIGDFARLFIPVQLATVTVLFVMALPLALVFGFSGRADADLTLSLPFSMFVFYLHYFTDRLVWLPTH